MLAEEGDGLEAVVQDRLRAVRGLADAGQERLAVGRQVAGVLDEGGRLAEAAALRAVGVRVLPRIEDAGVVRVERLHLSIVAVEQFGPGELAVVIAAVAVAAIDPLDFYDLGDVGQGYAGEAVDDG